MTHFPRVTAPNFSLGGAKRLLPVNASREVWLEARKTGFGASDASSILGLSTYGDRNSVWSEKLGLTKERPDTEAMYWGRAHEPSILKRFGEDSGYKLRRSGILQSPRHSFMLYTPDAISEDGGLVEAKTAVKFTAEEWADGGIPDHAYAQVQQGLAVTGRSHAWICGLIDGRDWQIRRIDRDEALIDLIVREETILWDMVLTGEEPPVGPYSGNAIRDRFPVAKDPLVLSMDSAEDRETLAKINLQITARDLADAKGKDAEKSKAIASNNIAVLIKNADEVKVKDGDSERRIMTFKNTARFSTTRFKEYEPELAKRFTPHEAAMQWDEIRAEFPGIVEAVTKTVEVIDEERLESIITARVVNDMIGDGYWPAEGISTVDEFEELIRPELEIRLGHYLRRIPSGPIDEAKLKAARPATYLEYRSRVLKIDKIKTAPAK